MREIPIWLVIAFGYGGESELPGKGSNPKILAMATRLGGWIKSFFTDDDIPWCALFVNNCLAEAGLKGTGSLAARSFLQWGISLSEPSLGAVVVFVRPGGGHVGFYLGESADHSRIRVYGGNQKNAVNETWLTRERLIDIRWPSDALPPEELGPIVLAEDGMPVSTNEG